MSTRHDTLIHKELLQAFANLIQDGRLAYDPESCRYFTIRFAPKGLQRLSAQQRFELWKNCAPLQEDWPDHFTPRKLGRLELRARRERSTL